jgi:hypothetical protein
MKKITIVGATSPAKIVIRTALDLVFDIVDLLPDELSLNNIGTNDLVIYIAELVDEQTFERLRIGHKSLILVSTAESELLNADFFIQSADLQSSDTEKILEGIRSIKEFIDRSTVVELSDDHKKLYDLLKEKRSEKYIRDTLGIGRTKYYEDRKYLRLLLGADNNGQLPYIAS